VLEVFANMKWGLRRRLLFVFIATGAALGFAELVLCLGGYGAPGERPDPFRGYSSHHPVFVKGDRVGGSWQVSTSDFSTGMRPQGFSHPKPTDTARVFLIGGSSVAGLYLRKHQTLSRQLGSGLSKHHADLDVEVINAGREGKSSHTVLKLLDEVLRYEPDLLVFYLGHNDWPNSRWDAEFIDPGLGTRLRMGLDQSRIYVGLRSLIQSGGASEVPPAFDTPPGGELGRGELGAVERRFEENMEAVLERAAAAGVQVVLCTVISNPYSPPADCGPNGAPDGRENEACQHFVSGMRLDEASDPLASMELKMAVQKDSIPVCAWDDLNEVLRTLSARHDTTLVDLVQVMDGGFETVRGQPLFVDDLHPNAVGNQRIAEAIATRVFEEGLLQAEAAP